MDLEEDETEECDEHDDWNWNIQMPSYHFNPCGYPMMNVEYHDTYPPDSPNIQTHEVSSGEEDDDEEDEEGAWYRFPQQATFSEDTKTMVLNDVPFSDRILEFQMKGSIRLFRAKVCNQKTLNLITQSKIFQENPPIPVQELSAYDYIAPLVESARVKEQEGWKLIKKGHVEGVLSQKLKDTLTKSAKEKPSISNILNTTDNSLTFSSQDPCSRSMFSSLQAEKLKQSSSELEGPFKGKLPSISQEDTVQEKFYRKMLATHVKGSALLDLSMENLDPKTLEGFKTLDELMLHCTSVYRNLAASREFFDVMNVSMTKEWATFRSKIRNTVTEGVQPEELKSSMRDAELWTDDLWSAEQKQNFVGQARAFAATKTFDVTSNSSRKRKQPTQGDSNKNWSNEKHSKTNYNYGKINRGGRGSYRSQRGRGNWNRQFGNEQQTGYNNFSFPMQMQYQSGFPPNAPGYQPQNAAMGSTFNNVPASVGHTVNPMSNQFAGFPGQNLNKENFKKKKPENPFRQPRGRAPRGRGHQMSSSQTQGNF